MSQEFTDEELDAIELDMGSNPESMDDAPADEVTGDHNEPTNEEPGEDNLAAQQEVDETAETPDDSQDETNPEGQVQNPLAQYLKETPMEAKSKSARFLIDTPEKLQESINKSLDYHKKTAELAQWRGDIEVIQTGGLTRDDLILLSEAKKGNKDAIAALAGNSNIDLYDVSEEDAANFVPTQHYATEQELQMTSIAEEIQNDPEVSAQFVEYIPDMPTDFKDLLNNDPAVLRGFGEDIKSGVAQKVYPQALAAQAMYGGTFLENYQRTGAAIFGGQQAPQNQQQPSAPAQDEAPRELDSRERDLRSRASATTQRQSSGGKTFLKDAKDIWDMSEADFDNLSSEDLRKMGN